MAVETLKKVASQIALDNGTDAQGNAKTVNISLARMAKDGYDATKYLAIVAALEPCLAKTITGAYVIKTSAVTAQ